MLKQDIMVWIKWVPSLDKPRQILNRWRLVGNFSQPARKVWLLKLARDIDSKPSVSKSASQFALVTSGDQNSDLDCQVSRARAWITGYRYFAVRVTIEVGPTLEGQNPRLMARQCDARKDKSLNKHRGRLCQVEGECIRFTLKAQAIRSDVTEAAALGDVLLLNVNCLLAFLCVPRWLHRLSTNKAQRAIDLACA